jgi:DNA-directed RNA polymerase subunit F
MSFQRREPREHVTAGFAFEKPVRAEKKPKPLRPHQAAPGEPRKFSTLSRGKPMKKAPPKRISERVADRPYLSWLASQACVVTGAFRGGGVVIELNHAGVKPGIALKCSDLETLPFEREIHRQWTEYSGRFKSWTRDQRRSWADARIVEHLERFIAWAPERSAELAEELRTYADPVTNEEKEIAADLTQQALRLIVCRERAIEKRSEVVARMGGTT